ncbi:hypothetical protein CDLVIII_1644 [Clostridium sp. DL-VIII]|uniref:DUF6903 family protein n=1 Tax=Clostridium sp. DL-VIII TaxID=641107 RepID=UPI00023AFC92|nr:hypothetical protein [Clostridium sp. DL-VIII]EHI98335.1 hypothetical protein CDLVIII_1644 [Clostridium sp. DL-VIII]
MKKIIYILIFLISIFLVIEGRSINNYIGLLIMFIGLGGILAEVYLYNKQYL